MASVVSSSEFRRCSMQYAIIEARQSEAGPGSERFVIAYRNQQSLHDVRAEPRIIAIGFSSREEAAASNTACVSFATTKQVPRATVVEKQHDGFHWTKWRRDREEKKVQSSRDLEDFLSPPTALWSLRPLSSSLPGTPSPRQSGWHWAAPPRSVQRGDIAPRSSELRVRVLL